LSDQNSVSPKFAANETLGEARKRLATALAAAGKEPAALESRHLMEEATGLTPLALLMESERRLGDDAATLLQLYASRRLAGEPVSRILERSGFYGLNLRVGKEVLDPRADTETLVDAALALLERRKIVNPRILDLGTGSGAVLCALLRCRDDAFGIGVDLSKVACDLTRHNLALCGVSGRSGVICGDWTQALRGPFDLIVSNPPYIASEEIASLESEVAAFDPILALDGGADGLGPYRRIASDLKRLLSRGGGACFEIGWRQAADVSNILAVAGFPCAKVLTDGGKRDRVIAIDAA
jgi:release factor glutamine methyltransferase